MIVALGLHDHRHPPNNAVALGFDREQATPAGCLFQNRRCCAAGPEIEHETLRVFAQLRQPRHRQRLVEFREAWGSPDSPSTTRECRIASAKIWSLLGSARNLPRVSSSRLRKRVGRDVGIEPIGLREDDVEGDHNGAKPGQIGDEVRDPCPRPGPLTEFCQALFVDIDNGDRPCGLHAGIDSAGKYRRF